jgi:asparagine synthase (glutamine-hydrolysing)
MSIQAGILNFDHKPVNHAHLRQMSAQAAPFGPDREDLYIADCIGMAYRAFDTTPESCLERQPHLTGSGKVITWDGRLDNRDDLIAQFPELPRKDITDLAIVAAGIERWDTDCFTRLIGDWALTIWDPQNCRLLLARDYIGIRTLFYRPTACGVQWCTLLEPLLMCGDQFHLCDEYMAGYLSVVPDAHVTPFRDIRSVTPGCLALIQQGRTVERRFWTFNHRNKTRYTSDREYEEHFRHLFSTAIRSRLRSNHPVLADLSGGLDSSSIVCMSDHIDSRSKVDTFTFFDSSEPDEEDIWYFQDIERFRGKIGHHVNLKGTGETFELTRPSVFAEPGFGARRELMEAKTALVHAGNYRVVLSGNGGDHMLGQGLDARAAIADLLVQCRPLAIGRQLVAWGLDTRRPAVQILTGAMTLLLPQALRSRLTGTRRNPPWINRMFARKWSTGDRMLSISEGSIFWLPTTREKYQYVQRLRGELTHIPPSSYEMRYPYLDRRLVEFLFSVPSDQLFRAGQRRSLMRRALAGIVPDSVLMRRTKSGTGRCIITTVNKHAEQVQILLTSSLSAQYGYLDQLSFRNAITDLLQGKVSRYIGPLLQALALEVWLRELSKRNLLVRPGPSSSPEPISSTSVSQMRDLITH